MSALKPLVRHILAHADQYDWSIQGFGLLRLYLPGDARLHIWDHARSYQDVSMIHDHIQWGLTSTVVAGQLTNTRYLELPAQRYGLPITYINNTEWELYNWATFKAGFDAKQLHDPDKIWLKAMKPEIYMPGDSYHQEPREIHETAAQPGTVTVMQKFPSEDAVNARIFWPVGMTWGTAAPRPATAEEVSHFVKLAQGWGL